MGSNINEGDDFSYEQIRDYSPPLTKIAIKHVSDIYTLCEKNRNTGLKKSEWFLNISTFSLGFVSVAIYFNNKYVVYVLIFVAVFFYSLWIFARKEENQNLEVFSNNIMSLMPLSKDEVIILMTNNKRIEEERIKCFFERSKPIYN